MQLKEMQRMEDVVPLHEELKPFGRHLRLVKTIEDVLGNKIEIRFPKRRNKIDIIKDALIISTASYLLFSAIYTGYKGIGAISGMLKPDYSYTVKKGDSLSHIAGKCCDVDDWPFIYNHNKLRSDRIKPGQEIIIPGHLVQHDYGFKRLGK